MSKDKKKKKRRKKNYLLRLIILIAVGVGLYYFAHSEIFDISKVEVLDNQYYTVEQVKDRAGIKIGENIFEFNKSKLKKKLLKDPYLENVIIKRKLPSTIEIQVQERTEKLFIPRGQKFIILDDKGLILRKADTEPKLTGIEGLTVKKAKIGKPLEVEENSILTDTLYMVRAMENSDIFFKRIEISNVIIRAYIYDQLICEGTPENLTASIENGNLGTALYEMYSKGIERGIIKIGSDNYCSFDPNVE